MEMNTGTISSSANGRRLGGKTAIIGTGIAGMGCAHFLHQQSDLTIYEQNDYVGGHTNTVTVDEDGKPVYIDTGFMVFNFKTYPNLCKLFDEIKAPVKKTDMSFSVQHVPSGLEYSGSSVNHLFAQRKNLFNLKYLKMLNQIGRFNKESIKILDDPKYANYSIGEYVKEFDFGEDMLWKYLVPMSSAVWSTPMEQMLDFPAVTLIRFFLNHGFLGLDTQHQWYTLEKGSRAYREILIKPFKDRISINRKAVKVERQATGKVVIHASDGTQETFDRVIIAAHGDQALQMLEAPTGAEERLLSKFKYQYNKAVLHTDTSIMPKAKLAWSSWNYRIQMQEGKLTPTTIYWMNRLQQVSDKKDYFVSINPHNGLDERKIIKELDYEHPLFDVPAINAQAELHRLNETGPVYFCGSYFKYGFHEDAFASAVELCVKLLADRMTF
ncbi:NAD(P)/FAD-dependent oxidoreductase [Mucilaginibacter gotjawali]|uniref:NAD/FAD-binding protein n=2 Tax=Mucilaginibacter gotjawali TaxID=1550579 RepID=A0A839SJB7_9SPHI|nr:FAD-dependent oxidoreductase [Mucilaginibacter gotjawali]MBB3057926.1 putative NAD/FAD-binding protein [Mucilaginibacter gotjawali]BAU52302.1 protoporphyrinogen oxidase [Mucilaginibacter gotjawali]